MHFAIRAVLVSTSTLLPGIADAHARLDRAEPPVGGTVRAAPAQMDLTFSEAIEPRFSTVAVTNASGAKVDKGDLHVVAGDGRHVTVSLGPLSSGTYRVEWHATSVDTHKSEGNFTFTVAP